SIGKARTAVLFQKPTKVFEDIINKGRTAMAALPDSFFTPLQGGIPVVFDGQIIGGVGVSGASSAAQDEELAIAGAEAAKIFGSEVAAASLLPVTYFAKKDVDEGFAKGSVLFDGTGGRNYMVHASRRETPGMVEVHTKDTDILYVLKGTATVVTGGTMVDGNNIAPDEIRGREITSGETRKLVPGDVMIIPSGVPHWFKEDQAPFLYYVVIVRYAGEIPMTTRLFFFVLCVGFAFSVQPVAAQHWAAQAPPYGRPDATIDLRTREGVQLIKGD